MQTLILPHASLCPLKWFPSIFSIVVGSFCQFHKFWIKQLFSLRICYRCSCRSTQNFKHEKFVWSLKVWSMNLSSLTHLFLLIYIYFSQISMPGTETCPTRQKFMGTALKCMRTGELMSMGLLLTQNTSWPCLWWKWFKWSQPRSQPQSQTHSQLHSRLRYKPRYRPRFTPHSRPSLFGFFLVSLPHL